jgi:cytochrome c553
MRLSRSSLAGMFVIGMLIAPMASSGDELCDVLEIEQGNPVLGKRKVQSENCQECHGEFGVGISPSTPKLAGQYANYIVKQLQNFQSGERKHPVMNVMSEGLGEDDIADIAAWFSGNKTMQGESAVASLLAKVIFTRGDMTRNILPCKSCHGETGKGKFSETGSYPVIGGQQRVYLREQLRNWRSGARANSPGGVMNIIAKYLSDDEIEALANYISGL